VAFGLHFQHLLTRFLGSVADAVIRRYKRIWSQKGPATLGVSFAPRCDVTASQLGAAKNRANQPGFLCL